MRILRILAAGILLSFFALSGAQAQQANMYWCTSTTIPCPPSGWVPTSAANPLPVTASVSASISGFPGTTQTTGTPISVTTGGVTGTLPAGTVVVASNVGATNNAYCKLGASATTSDQMIPPNSWFGFTVGSNTQLTCITSTSTTTVNMVGGAGLPTGAGGGGGGGSSGAVYGPTAAGSAAANPPVLLGGTADGTATGNVDNWKVASGLGYVTGVSGTFPSTQSGTWTVQPGNTPNTTPWLVNATLQAAATTAIGKVDPNTIGNWGLQASTQNSATPTNAGLVMGQFNTTPTTITSGNVSPLQLDSAARLIVNCDTGCSGSAGTPTASSVSVGSSSGTLIAPTTFSNFIKVCIASTAANGIWVNWAGAAATQAPPSEYIPPGQCDSWVKSSGFLPTGTITAIASTTVSATVIGN